MEILFEKKLGFWTIRMVRIPDSVSRIKFQLINNEKEISVEIRSDDNDNIFLVDGDFGLDKSPPTLPISIEEVKKLLQHPFSFLNFIDHIDDYYGNPP